MVKGQPNEQLIRNLSPSSSFLTLLRERFDEKFTLKDSKIICVFETKTTPTVEVSWLGSWYSARSIIDCSNSGPREQHHGKELERKS